MVEPAWCVRPGFLVVGTLVGERAPTLRARRRAIGTLTDGEPVAGDPSGHGEAAPAPARGADARLLRVRLVELLASDGDHESRTSIMRQLARLGNPLPAGVIRALATLARDPDPRVRWAASTTLVHLLEVMGPMERSELIGRLATSSRLELRLLVAQALRFGSLAVGTISALEHLVDDPDAEVGRAALVSARLRLAQAPSRMLGIMRRKLQP
jgi:hypothetical protein